MPATWLQGCIYPNRCPVDGVGLALDGVDDVAEVGSWAPLASSFFNALRAAPWAGAASERAFNLEGR